MKTLFYNDIKIYTKMTLVSRYKGRILSVYFLLIGVLYNDASNTIVGRPPRGVGQAYYPTTQGGKDMRKHKLSHRFMAIALSVVMALGMMPVTASANTPYNGNGWGLDDTGHLTIDNDNGMYEWMDAMGSYTDVVTEVTISNGVTFINDYAFDQFTLLQSITIPDSVTSIGGNAFDGCIALKKVTIPSSVLNISAKAFGYCSGLESVTFQGDNPPLSLGTNIFIGCSGLQKIYVPAGSVETYKAAANLAPYADKIVAAGTTVGVQKRTTLMDLTWESIDYHNNRGSMSEADPLSSDITDTGEGWEWYSNANSALGYSANTLVLNGIDLVTEDMGIVLPADSTIVLADGSENTINISSEYDIASIFCVGNLIITGKTGSLDVTSGDTTANTNIGIYTLRDLIIDGGNITVISGDANNSSAGIYAYRSCTISNGTIIAKCGSAHDPEGEYFAIYAENGINDSGMTVRQYVDGDYTGTVTNESCYYLYHGSFANNLKLTNGTPTTVVVPVQRTTTLDLSVDSISYQSSSGSSAIANPLANDITNTGEGWAWYLNANVDAGYSAKTLVLNGINLETANNLGIVLPEGSTILLANGSENRVSITNSTEAVKGIIANGDLIMSGNTGSLQVITGNTIGNGSHGIYSSGNITLSGGIITVNKGDTVNNTSVGIFSSKNITVSGGKITVNIGNARNFAAGIDAAGVLTISNGTIYAKTGSTTNTHGVSCPVIGFGGLVDDGMLVYQNIDGEYTQAVMKSIDGGYYYYGDDITATDIMIVNGTPTEPSATSGNITVSGTTGTPLSGSDTISITLSNTSFTGLQEEEDVSAWFSNLPQGLTAAVKSVSSTSATIAFSGTPSEASDNVMEITISADKLTSGGALSVTTNSDTKFDITKPIGLQKRTTSLDMDHIIYYINTSGDIAQADPTADDITDTSEGWAWYLNENTALGYPAQTLVLNGIDLESTDRNGIVNLPDSSTIELADNTKNYVIVANNANLPIHCKGDLNIKGSTGSLNITTGNSALSANYGIFSYGNITIYGGNITVEVGDSSFISYGILTMKYFRISGGTVYVKSGYVSNPIGISTSVVAHMGIDDTGMEVLQNVEDAYTEPATADYNTSINYHYLFLGSELATDLKFFRDKSQISNSAGTATVTYDGATIDLTAVSGLFTVDEDAGAQTYTVETGGTGAGTITGSLLTVTKAGTISIGLTTAETTTHQAGAKVTATLTVDKGTQSALTGLGKIDVTDQGNNGKITGLTANTVYEYKKDRGSYIRVTSSSSGEITDLGAGTYVVRIPENVLLNASPDSADIIIGQPILIGEITISGGSTITTKGGTLQLTSVISPVNAANKTVYWSIQSGSTYADISSTGMLTAKADGTVIVRATSQDGSDVFGEVTISISGQTVVNNNNGGNNGNTGNNSSEANNGAEKITIDVKKGNTDSTVSTITIERTTGSDGKKKDTVSYDKKKADETVQKLKEEGKDTARIVIPESKEEVSETLVNIPSESVHSLSSGEINLQIDTVAAKIDITADTLKKISQTSEEDLYFRLVPIKDEEQKEAVSNRALIAAGIINADDKLEVIGNPVTIETNMSSTEANITLPLTGVKIPTDSAEREALLKQLAIYIEHSDGEKELVQGELVEFGDGIYGIRFHITKFSIFTVVKTDAFLKSSESGILSVTSPSEAVINGTKIAATVANKTDSVTVKVKVSKKASWKLYSDKACTKELTGGKLKLKTGSNTAYIRVTAEDGTGQTYKLAITKEKSSKALITKVSVPEKAKIEGEIISAAVANDINSLTIKAEVSSKASWKLYSDKKCTKEIANNKLSLKEGVNTAYLKVTAENGKTSRVYTLKITRSEGSKAQYETHVKLGLIGSKVYAQNVSEIFKQEYDTANVTIKQEGKYYQITMDFTDKTAANKACKDMIKRKYIVNYYFYK